MASEIPGDLMAKARTLADDALTFGYTQGVLDIALALLAERRSCSVIARDAALYSGCPADFIADEIADTVLNAIRQNNPNEQDERYRALAEMAEEAKKLGLK